MTLIEILADIFSIAMSIVFTTSSVEALTSKYEGTKEEIKYTITNLGLASFFIFATIALSFIIFNKVTKGDN